MPLVSFIRTNAKIAAAVLGVIGIAALLIVSRGRNSVPALRSNSVSAVSSCADETAAVLNTHYPKRVVEQRELNDESQLAIIENPSGEGFVLDTNELSQIEGNAREKLEKPGWHPIDPAKYVRPIFPARFANTIQVTSQTHQVRATPLNANPASAAKIAGGGGSLIYADAFPGCDVAYRCSALKTEEYIVVRDSFAQTEWSWNLDCGTALKPRLTPANTIEFADSKGVPRLRINAPEGKDAAGTRLRVGERLTLTLTGSQITVAADVKGLRFPVVIDPSWSSTGSMAFARYFHTATRLLDGTVLVAGGLGALPINQGKLASAELYDPNTMIWTTVGSLNNARVSHTATLLSNGKVLVVAGEGVDPSQGVLCLTSCEIYDPASKIWNPTTSISGPREHHATTLLKNGLVLIAGGYDGHNTLYTTCFLYNPVTEAVANAGSLTHQRQISTLIPWRNNGALMLGGGTTCEAYDPVSTNWSDENFGSDGLGYSVVFANGQSLTGGAGNVGCSIYDPVADSKIGTGNSLIARDRPAAALLGNGKVLACGGVMSTSTWLASAEFYDLSSGSWATTSSMGTARDSHSATTLINSTVLVAGGRNLFDTYSSCEIFDPMPQALPQTISVHGTALGSSVNVVLQSDVINAPVTYTVGTNPQRGVLSGTAPNLTYTSNPGFSGVDTFPFKVNDGFYPDSKFATITINVTNIPPTVTSGASPINAVPNSPVSFTANGSDADGDALTYSWDFGDGSTSTDQNPAHSFTDVGIHTATVTVTDPVGAAQSSSVNIQVSFAPNAQFFTSDVVAFVGHPFVFDAGISTDPANDIAAYAWDFGDGSPLGSGQSIVKTYAQAGDYLVTLVVTNSTGTSDTVTRIIHVLPGSDFGTVSGSIAYHCNWDRSKMNKDALTLQATVSVGNLAVTGGTLVACEIAGQRFTGTLDSKLNDRSNPNARWIVKAGSKSKPAGNVSVTLTVKKANLGAGFNAAGAVIGSDPKATVKLSLPVKIEIGGQTFELAVPSAFKFSHAGTTAKGSGNL